LLIWIFPLSLLALGAALTLWLGRRFVASEPQPSPVEPAVGSESSESGYHQRIDDLLDDSD
jgi:hypothetical protein